MENWKKFLLENDKNKDAVIQSINKDKIKDRFKVFIEKYKQQIPDIDSIVDKYIEMKMKQKSSDYSDLADYVVKNRKSTEKTPPQEDPTLYFNKSGEKTSNPAEFDPTDHRNWSSR